MAKTNTKNVSGVIKVTREIGDKLMDQHNETGDLKVAQLSLKAYGTAIAASKAQLIYKKMTGRPTTIDFLED